MPNRIVREGILTSDKIDQLDAASEVFYRRLLSKVDDHGLYDARPAILRSALFPLRVDRVREADITRWIAACEKAGVIALYRHDGKPYLEVLNTQWQARSEPKYPRRSASASICAQVQTTARLDVVVDVVEDVEKPLVRQAARFGDFWTAFPARPGKSKVNKKGCLAKWKARGLDAMADVILADVALRKRTDRRWLDGFCPDPETYLNQDRWDDGPPEGAAPATNQNHGGVSPRLSPEDEKRRQAEALAAMEQQMRELGHG